jgi:single-stranded-DNA-specific exonuclease
MTAYKEVKIGNKLIKIPTKKVKLKPRNDRVFDCFRKEGFSTLLSNIVAKRLTDSSEKSCQAIIKPSLRDMNYWMLKDIEKAARRIIKAIHGKETIALVTDFDVDGITSSVVMYKTLVEYFGVDKKKVQVHINNRIKFGYGFNEKALGALFDRNAKAKKPEDYPTLVITADQGSLDTATIAKYNDYMSELGLDYASVIVTDHHHVDQKLKCPDAYAFINPQRDDDDFTDKTISGCAVAYLLMNATKDILNKEYEYEIQSLVPLISFVGLSTIADCMSLKSSYNRCFVLKAIKDINDEVYPAWHVLKKQRGKVDIEEIGFFLAPIINADSRMGGDGKKAFDFLTATTINKAEELYTRLVVNNEKRKTINKQMENEAIEIASKLYFDEGKRGLIIHLKNGEHGIHGIVASRIKEMFNCPVIIFSPADKKEMGNGELSGSGRSINGIDLAQIYNEHLKEHVIKGGGHSMALGMKIKEDKLPLIAELFDREVKKKGLEHFDKKGDVFVPFIDVDVVLSQDEVNGLRDKTLLKTQKAIAPYGQKFEQPIFAFNVKLASCRETKTEEHLQLSFVDANGAYHSAIAFYYKKETWVDSLEVGENYTVMFTIQEDGFNPDKTSIIIKDIRVGFNAFDV